VQTPDLAVDKNANHALIDAEEPQMCCEVIGCPPVCREDKEVCKRWEDGREGGR
jgi:hypothetical protein